MDEAIKLPKKRADEEKRQLRFFENHEIIGVSEIEFPMGESKHETVYVVLRTVPLNRVPTFVMRGLGRDHRALENSLNHRVRAEPPLPF